jgi:hypothetical protein
VVDATYLGRVFTAAAMGLSAIYVGGGGTTRELSSSCRPHAAADPRHPATVLDERGWSEALAELKEGDDAFADEPWRDAVREYDRAVEDRTRAR